MRALRDIRGTRSTEHWNRKARGAALPVESFDFDFDLGLVPATAPYPTVSYCSNGVL